MAFDPDAGKADTPTSVAPRPLGYRACVKSPHLERDLQVFKTTMAEASAWLKAALKDCRGPAEGRVYEETETCVVEERKA